MPAHSHAEGPPPVQPVVDVRAASHRYGPRPALERASLRVMPGEFVALLGPNGAGKTTLFQLLTGLHACQEGSVRLCGHDLRLDPLPGLARLGVVFQQPTLDLDLTVEANLRYHARLQGMGRRAASAIDRELERQGLTQERRSPCRTLSGGNRRRVELARALLHSPRALLLDEATAGLDPASRRALRDHVRQLCHDEAVGVLWATHLVDEAEQADCVVILHRGRVVRRGPPGALLVETRARNLEQAFLDLVGPVAKENPGEAK